MIGSFTCAHRFCWITATQDKFSSRVFTGSLLSVLWNSGCELKKCLLAKETHKPEWWFVIHLHFKTNANEFFMAFRYVESDKIYATLQLILFSSDGLEWLLSISLLWRVIVDLF